MGLTQVCACMHMLVLCCVCTSCVVLFSSCVVLFTSCVYNVSCVLHLLKCICVCFIRTDVSMYMCTSFVNGRATHELQLRHRVGEWKSLHETVSSRLKEKNKSMR